MQKSRQDLKKTGKGGMVRKRPPYITIYIT